MEESDVEAKLLAAANRHPNSKVGKLLQEYLNDSNRTTLVLLLEELEKNDEYAADFTISISYFLDQIERHIRNWQFSELGRKLMAIGRIWGKRVEELYRKTESQAFGLTKSSEQTETPDGETEAPNEASTSAGAAAAAAAGAAKPRNRKRPIHNDTNELKMEPKAFKRAAVNKLFVDCEDKETPQMLPYYFTEEHINPTLYKNSFLIDPDNADNTERKNNYKIFHYHIEHRYNTPVSDYNFRLHFAIKDYMHNEDIDDDPNNEFDELAATEYEQWTPQDYLDKAIGLENQAFEGQLSSTMYPRKRKSNTELEDPVEKQPCFPNDDTPNIIEDPKTLKTLTSQDSGIDANLQTQTEHMEIDEIPNVADDVDGIVQENQNESIGTDLSFNPETQAANSSEIANDSITNNPENIAENQSQLVEDGGINNRSLPDFNPSSFLESTKLVQDAKDTNTDLGFAENRVLPDVVMITDKLSQSDDEGIVLSDQEESLYRQSPIENMEHEAIQDQNINDNIIDINVVPVVEEELYIRYPLIANIFEFKENILRRQTNFRLPLEINCIHQERLSKAKTGKVPNETKKLQTEAKATSQLNKYNRMGAPDSIFSHAQRTESLMSDEGNESENGEGDFIGFDISTTTWSNGTLVFPREGTDEIPEMRDANTDAHITNDPPFIENKEQTSEQSVLEVEQCNAMPNDEINIPEMTDNIIENVANISIGSQQKDQELLDEILDDFANIDISLPEINSNNTIEDHDDNPSEETFMESEETNPEHFLMPNRDQRVRIWHRTIGPHLAKAHERHHFSVYDIGTNIIEKVENGASNMETITSDDVPENISKNFLSLLILTNQENVSLHCGKRNYDYPVALNKLEVKLISSKRHSVHIEDDIGSTHLIQPPPKRKAIEPKTIASTSAVSFPGVSTSSPVASTSRSSTSSPIASTSAAAALRLAAAASKLAAASTSSTIASTSRASTSSPVASTSAAAASRIAASKLAASTSSPVASTSRASTSRPSTSAAAVVSTSAAASMSRATTTMTTNTTAPEVQQMVRTLQPIPKAKNTDDNDSGVGSFISRDSIS